MPVNTVRGKASRREAAPFLSKADPRTSNDWFRIQNKKNDEDEIVATDIYIYDEIGFWGTTADDFVKQLNELDTPQINLHVNSPGGEIFDGVAIYNALRNHKASVTVMVDGLAASAASFIAQAGDKVVMGKASTMMIHDGLAFCIGNEQDMLDTANVLSKLSNNIAGIYASRAGGTTEEWRALMREEVWYNAEEAVEAGLADEVSGDSGDDEDKAKNRWDLSIFNHAGRSNAPSPKEVRQRIYNRVQQGADMTTGTSGTGVVTMNVTQPKMTDTPPEPATGPDQPTQPAPTPSSPVKPDAAPDTAPSPDTAPDPAPAPENKAPAFSFMVNGVATTDLSKVQAHITALETYRDEAIQAGRKNFVSQLAVDKKISATQVEGLEEFALSLTDEQYDKWKASWEAAPVVPLFALHGGGGTGTQPQAAAARDDEIATLEGIVKHHRDSGMPQDQIEKLPSYQKLQNLKQQS